MQFQGKVYGECKITFNGLDKKGTVGAVEEDQYIVSAITPLSMI
jgi:hypothetical protein